jgi:hypothetical protein
LNCVFQIRSIFLMASRSSSRNEARLFSKPQTNDMKKNLTTLLLASFGMLMLCIQPALANHPLLQNGWLKAATANSVTIATPKGGGDVTFTLSEKTKIRFFGADGTVVDLQALAAQMGTQRILVNIRRDAPASTSAVLVGLKVAKPAAAPAPAPDAAATPTGEAAPAAEAPAPASDASSAGE